MHRDRTLGLVCVAFALFLATTTADAQQMVFPGADWDETTPESLLVDPAKLVEAVDYLEANSPFHGVEELVIIRNGRMIWKGPNIDRMHVTHSAAKSFTSTMLGLLIDDGKATRDTLAKDYVPVLAAAYPTTTLRHFATMTSGYLSAGPIWNKWGWTPYPFVPTDPWFPPGSQYFYQDPPMEQFARVLTQIAQEPLEDLFRRRIADPIGMDPTKWDWEDFSFWDYPELVMIDGFLHNLGSNGMEISAREAARFAHLFLNRGHWDGQQLISSAWVDEATKVQVDAALPLHPLSPVPGGGVGVYGYNWWPNGVNSEGHRLFPGATPGTYCARGHLNNFICVFPEWNMVAVRLGTDGDTAGGYEIPLDTWGAFFGRLGSASMTAAWDQGGDGNWEDFDPATGESRWVNDNRDHVAVYPDDQFADAVIGADTVTVLGDRATRSLTVENGGLDVAPTGALSVAGDAVFAGNAVLSLAAGTNLNVAGSLEMTDALITSGLGPDTAGLIDVAGDVQFDGETLLALEFNGAAPFLARTYTLVRSAGTSGITGELTLLTDLSAYLAGDGLVSSSESVVLTFNKALNPGDANLDTITDVRDFNVWNAHKFTDNTEWISGDFNGDGITDVRDFNKWNAAKFTSATGGAALVEGQVPEPGALVLLATVAIASWILLVRRPDGCDSGRA